MQAINADTLASADLPYESSTTVSRSLGAESATPFAVSGPRGVAAVVQGAMKVLLFDLEENEDAGNEVMQLMT